MKESIIAPKSIAIVGASDNKKKIASVILTNLKKDGYQGKIYPVNPKYEMIDELKCYPSVKAIPKHLIWSVSLFLQYQ
jgi:acyl-CoA synthetase (NDP forming)